MFSRAQLLKIHRSIQSIFADCLSVEAVWLFLLRHHYKLSNTIVMYNTNVISNVVMLTSFISFEWTPFFRFSHSQAHFENIFNWTYKCNGSFCRFYYLKKLSFRSFLLRFALFVVDSSIAIPHKQDQVSIAIIHKLFLLFLSIQHDKIDEYFQHVLNIFSTDSKWRNQMVASFVAKRMMRHIATHQLFPFLAHNVL